MPSSNAAQVLRAARRRSGLTQTEVAAAVGVDQPQISAYESGRRDPTIQTLDRLLRGAGHRLHLDAEHLAVLPGEWTPLTLAEVADEVLRARRTSQRRRLVLEFVRGAREADRWSLRAMVRERPGPAGEGWDALLAGMAEHLSFHEDLEPPIWVFDEDRFLDTAWFWVDLPSVRRRALLTAPAAFRRRNVWLDRSDLETV